MHARMWSVSLAFLACFVLPPSPAEAVEHAKIELTVIGPKGQETAYVDQTPPAHGKNPRPVLETHAGDRIRVRYLLRNVYPHKTLENVVVHFYIAPIATVGQKELPDLQGEDLVLETAFDVDLRPGAQAGARTTLGRLEPGVYLIRIETRQTGSDHEHFAAIDLLVRPAP